MTSEGEPLDEWPKIVHFGKEVVGSDRLHWVPVVRIVLATVVGVWIGIAGPADGLWRFVVAVVAFAATIAVLIVIEFAVHYVWFAVSAIEMRRNPRGWAAKQRRKYGPR